MILCRNDNEILHKFSSPSLSASSISSLLDFCSHLALDAERTTEPRSCVSHGASLISSSSSLSSSFVSIPDSPQCCISPWPRSSATKLAHRGRSTRGCSREDPTCWDSRRSCRRGRARSRSRTYRRCSPRSSYTDLASIRLETFLDFISETVERWSISIQHYTIQ